MSFGTNKIKNIITSYLATSIPLKRYGFQILNSRNSRPVHQVKQKPIIIHSEKNQTPPNAIAQQNANYERERAQKKLVEYTTMLNITTENSMQQQLVHKWK
ncbi:17892_t:CDS:2 [Funneliformis geosporum]|nr:17892_t:CDS:2 [Funneliformis geosporum]